MGKSAVLGSIRQYSSVYGDVVAQIKKVKANSELTEQAKAKRISDIESNNSVRLAGAKNELIKAIAELSDELTASRKATVSNGMEDASKIALVFSGIQNGAYSTSMVKDIVDAFGGNPIALATIRTALAKSDNADYNTMALDMPIDNNSGVNRVLYNLENITNTLNDEHSISYALDSKDDMASVIYTNGQTFDNWYQYVSDNVSE